MKRKTIILSILTGLVCLAGIVFWFWKGALNAPTAKADITDNVSGWAWSDNIGWISFNCTNRNWCATSTYGVNIDSSTGEFSGYAWSDTIGWITFNQAELSGCPSVPCRAEVDLATGQVSGWARALAPKDDPQAGGWDGWISLQGTSPDYGVSIATSTSPKEFTGWAWGGDVVGWISFNCNNTGIGDTCGASTYKVEASLNFPPIVQNLNVEPTSYCSAPSQHFTWEFKDTEDATQTAYQIQISKDGDYSEPFPQAGEFDSGKISSEAQEAFVPVVINETENKLSYGENYHWRVMVWDSDGASSSWVDDGPQFDTPAHHYPEPSFTYSPSNPTKDETITFTEDSVCYNDSGSYLCQNGSPDVISYLWDFGCTQGVECTVSNSTATGTATTTYTAEGSYTVNLEITDSSLPAACSTSTSIDIMPTLPEWKETKP